MDGTRSAERNIYLSGAHVVLFKPATHLAILYADRGDRRIKWAISGMSDIGD